MHQVRHSNLIIPVPVKRLEARLKALLINCAITGLHKDQNPLDVSSEHLTVNVAFLFGVNLVIDCLSDPKALCVCLLVNFLSLLV